MKARKTVEGIIWSIVATISAVSPSSILLFPIKGQFIPSHQQTDPIVSPLSLILSLIKLHSLAMNTQNQHQQMPISRNSIPRLKLVDFSLRLSVIPLSLGSLWLTVTNNDDNPDYGSIKFLNFLGLKYMIAVAAIAAVYAIFAAISHWFGSLISKVWVFFVSDQVMAYLMVTSGSAGGELMYLAYKGDVQVTWSEACSSYGKFCSKLKIALILHFLAVFCFLVLAVISAFRAFSMFDPPIPSSETGGSPTEHLIN